MECFQFKNVKQTCLGTFSHLQLNQKNITNDNERMESQNREASPLNHEKIIVKEQ